MTVHIGLATNANAVLLSDSQGSTDRAEVHGWHKQFVGKNFAVGIAGVGQIIDRTFGHLAHNVGFNADKNIDELSSLLESFFDDEVRNQARQLVSVSITAYDSGSLPRFQVYQPGLFKTFGHSQTFMSIGSGSEFVNTARGRHQKLGIEIPLANLSELILAATYFADVANESLTVDDQHAVSILSHGKAYLLGDSELKVFYCPEKFRRKWPMISSKWKVIRGMCATINSEIHESHRIFSKIRNGTLSDFGPLVHLNTSIQNGTAGLSDEIDEFLRFVDSI